MTPRPGFDPGVWESNWKKFETAAGKVKVRLDAGEMIVREDLNEARARYHILTEIGKTYGWPTGQTQEHLDSFLPKGLLA